MTRAFFSAKKDSSNQRGRSKIEKSVALANIPTPFEKHVTSDQE
jgi:hypothetical protein